MNVPTALFWNIILQLVNDHLPAAVPLIGIVIHVGIRPFRELPLQEPQDGHGVRALSDSTDLQAKKIMNQIHAGEIVQPLEFMVGENIQSLRTMFQKLGMKGE